MRYRFYHELIYQVANQLANFHIALSKKHLRVMKKMVNRLRASVKAGELNDPD